MHKYSVGQTLELLPLHGSSARKAAACEIVALLPYEGHDGSNTTGAVEPGSLSAHRQRSRSARPRRTCCRRPDCRPLRGHASGAWTICPRADSMGYHRGQAARRQPPFNFRHAG